VKTFDVIKNYQAGLKADIECVNGVYNITLKNASSVYDPNISPITYTYSVQVYREALQGQVILLRG